MLYQTTDANGRPYTETAHYRDYNQWGSVTRWANDSTQITTNFSLPDKSITGQDSTVYYSNSTLFSPTYQAGIDYPLPKGSVTTVGI